METLSTQRGRRLEGPHDSGGHGFGCPSKSQRLEVRLYFGSQGKVFNEVAITLKTLLTSLWHIKGVNRNMAKGEKHI